MADYKVPAAPLEIEEIIKGSRFITRIRYVDTAEKAKAFLKERRELEPDATHHCWAYIVGNPSSTTLIGCSDDGEPSGTAGKPMLNVLQHSGIGDIIAVCTRFYGGTKLGTGGLARAYGGGVKIAIEQLIVQDKIDTSQVQLSSSYDCQKDIEHEMGLVDAKVLSTDYDESVHWVFELPTENLTTLKQQLTIRFGDKILWNSIQP